MAGSLDASTVALLGGTAFATAVLSAVVGMAGGMVLLAVMLLFLDPLVAIPLHGVVQLVSNTSRTWVQRRHVRRDVAASYAVLLLPAGFAGIAVATRVPPAALTACIGAFILVATWAPRALLLGTRPEAIDPRRRFLLLGGCVGFLGPSVGATGPLLAPFCLNLGLDRFGVIGTQAACQTLGHLAKIVVFGAAGFAFGAWLGPLTGLCAATMAGTWVGSRLLDRVGERAFDALYRTVLTVLALRLVLGG